MIKSLIGQYRNILNSKEYKNVFKNFGFLSVVQIANYLLPILTLPYLANVLGADKFGLLMFAQAFAQYFIMIVDYGFNFSATREIALNKENAKNVSEIFCSVIVSKLCLLLISLIILIFVVFTFEKFSSFRIIYFLSFVAVAGNVLFPTWFFQGLQQMKYITMVTLSSKLAYTVLIFIFVLGPEHLLLVPIIFSLSAIIPSAIALLHVKAIYPVTVQRPTYQSLSASLKSGWFIFLASVSSSLYGASNTFLLGILFNNTYAGYYSLAEKIIRACTSLFIPLNNALYPYMSLKMLDSREHGLRIFRKILVVTLAISSLGSVIIYFGSDFLSLIIDPEFHPSINVLKILSPLVAIIAGSNLIGFQIILTTSRQKHYLLIVFLAGILNLTLCLTLSPQFLYKSAAFSLVISEAFIFCAFLFLSKKLLLQKK